MSKYNLKLNKEELRCLISSLLFTCSVNVVSNATLDFQEKLFQLSKKIKQSCPDIQLKEVQFVKEEEYEDQLSSEIYKEFSNNIEIVKFEHV